MKSPFLKEVNYFYMLAFIFSGVFFGLSTLLAKVFTLGVIETALITTMAAQFAPGVAMTISRRKFHSPYKASFSPPALLSILLAISIPVLAIISQHLTQTWQGNPKLASPFLMSLPLVGLSITTAFLGSIGEELGWRGYLYNTLNQQLEPWVAATLTGLLWGLWHFTKIFSNGLPAYLLFTLSLIPLSFLMSYINDKTGASLLPSIIFHTCFNLASMYWLFQRESISGYLISAGVLTIIILVIRLLDPVYFKARIGPDTKVQEV